MLGFTWCCDAGSADNTRAALHFATAAARVVMRPQLNRVASSKAVIKAMASEIQQLKAKLVRGQSRRVHQNNSMKWGHETHFTNNTTAQAA